MKIWKENLSLVEVDEYDPLYTNSSTWIPIIKEVVTKLGLPDDVQDLDASDGYPYVEIPSSQVSQLRSKLKNLGFKPLRKNDLFEDYGILIHGKPFGVTIYHRDSWCEILMGGYEEDVSISELKKQDLNEYIWQKYIVRCTDPISKKNTYHNLPSKEKVIEFVELKLDAGFTLEITNTDTGKTIQL